MNETILLTINKILKRGKTICGFPRNRLEKITYIYKTTNSIRGNLRIGEKKSTEKPHVWLFC